MSFTTFANGLSVATKGTPHMARSTAPDVCKLPDNKPAPFPNYIMTTELGSGQTGKTLIQGNPIWTAAGILDASPSLPAHAGVNGGVTSGTYQGVAAPTQWSPDVLVECNGVVCMTHTTTQNDKNTVGIVDNAANLAAFLAEADAAAKAAAAAATTSDAGKPEEGPPPDATDEEGAGHGEEQGTDAEPGSDEEKKCFLQNATIQCSHKGRKANSQGLLEVVQPDLVSSADTLTMKATMGEGFSCDKHPEWTVTGWLKGKQIGVEVTQKVSGRFNTYAAGEAVLGILRVPPAKYDISCQAEYGKPNTKTFNVNVYPGGEHGFSISGNHAKVKALEETLKKASGKIETALGAEFNFKFLRGSIAFKLGWKENSDWRAYPELTITGGFNPLIYVEATRAIPWGPLEGVRMGIEKILNVVNDFLGTDIKIALEAVLSCAVNLTVDIARKFRIGEWVFNSAGAGIEISIGLQLVCAFKKSVLEASCSVSCSFSGDLKIEKGGGGGLQRTLSGNLGKLAGSIEVTANVGKIPWTNIAISYKYSKQVVFWQGYPIPGEPQPFLPGMFPP